MPDSGTPILGLSATAALLDTDVLPLARPSGTTAPGTNLGISGQALKALFGAGGVSLRWQAGGVNGTGGYKAGQLLYNSAGVDFYYLADAANPQAEPLLDTSAAATNALVHRLAEAAVWRYIGDPFNGNIALADFGASNILSAQAKDNQFGAHNNNLILNTNSSYNKFGVFCYGITLTNSRLNTFEGDNGDIAITDSNVVFIGLQSRYVTIEAGGYLISVAGNSQRIGIGAACKSIRLDNQCLYVTLGANCARVEVYNCQGTAAAPFVIPAGTTNAVYRNNALVPTGGTGSGGAAYSAGTGIAISGANVISATGGGSGIPNVSFLAKSTQSPVVANTTFTRILFPSLLRQSGQGTQGYNAANSQYVVPVTGCYDVRGVIEFQPASNTTVGAFFLVIFVNGQRRQDLTLGSAPDSNSYYGANGAQEIDLLAGDIVDLQTWNNTNGGILQGSEPYRSAFAMRLISY